MNIEKSCNDEKTVVDILIRTNVSVAVHNPDQTLMDCSIGKRAVNSQECSKAQVPRVDCIDWTQMVDTLGSMYCRTRG